MARPSIISADVAAAIIRAKAAGLTNEAAARAAGVSWRTIYRWLEQGNTGIEPFAAFAIAFRDAEERARRAIVDAAVAEMRQLAVA